MLQLCGPSLPNRSNRKPSDDLCHVLHSNAQFSLLHLAICFVMNILGSLLIFFMCVAVGCASGLCLFFIFLPLSVIIEIYLTVPNNISANTTLFFNYVCISSGFICVLNLIVLLLLQTGGTPVCTGCNVGMYTPGFACSYGNRGDWNNGIKTFMDPLPSGAIVLGVITKLLGAFDCVSLVGPAQVLLTLQKGEIANTELPQNLPCYCANCVGDFYVTSMSNEDWPGYNHTGINMLQIIVLGQNAICLNRVELIFSYYPGLSLIFFASYFYYL